MKKLNRIFLVASLALLVSCQDGAAKKITNANPVNTTQASQPAVKTDSPVMSFDKTTHDFGTIKEGEKVTTKIYKEGKVLEANALDGFKDQQTSKLKASARQLIRHLQVFINDYQHGVYAQHTLFPTESTMRGYSKLLDPNRLSDQRDQARRGIKDINKVVHKLENGQSFHYQELKKLKDNSISITFNYF